MDFGRPGIGYKKLTAANGKAEIAEPSVIIVFSTIFCRAVKEFFK